MSAAPLGGGGGGGGVPTGPLGGMLSGAAGGAAGGGPEPTDPFNRSLKAIKEVGFPIFIACVALGFFAYQLVVEHRELRAEQAAIAARLAAIEKGVDSCRR